MRLGKPIIVVASLLAAIVGCGAKPSQPCTLGAHLEGGRCVPDDCLLCDAGSTGDAANAADAGDPCSVSSSINTLVLDGDTKDFVHPGLAVIQHGKWGLSSDGSMTPFFIHVSLTPDDPKLGLWWDLEFSSKELNEPLAPKTYTGAERAPFASSGHPGLEISGDGRGCNMLSGTFTVRSFGVTNSTVTSLTADFEQHCEKGAPALRGCVHVAL